MKKSWLKQGDCLEWMRRIKAKSVNMILCDLPYGITNSVWDSRIPLKPLWTEYNRIIKKRGAIVLTSVQPFTSMLVMSNLKGYRGELIWDKIWAANFANAKSQVLRTHENILIFSAQAGQPRPYHPQFWYSRPYSIKESQRPKKAEFMKTGQLNKNTERHNPNGERFPLSIIRMLRDKDRIHPTQKPVALMEYLIKTYTNPGDLVLDNCMGSGTTGIACARTNRRFIGIEKDPDYFKLAEHRIRIAEKTGMVTGKPNRVFGFFDETKISKKLDLKNPLSGV